MRIKKVYLKNFKGIRDKKIIDFENPISLLIGPNGFGKTTIYDAIELCLTGKIYRTLTKESVTHHRKDYKKVFFQNDEKEDVVVKVWLEKSTNEELIITKYLPKNKKKREYKKGRKHKPDDFYLLQTYFDKPSAFYDDDFKPTESQILISDEINDFFEFDSKEIDIKDIYHLFNYLQQEETTYFLKKSESERKESLGFLFNTNSEELELQDVANQLKELRKINKLLEEKIKEMNQVKKITEVEYSQIFQSQDVKYDRKKLFEHDDLETLSQLRNHYITEVNQIIEFITRFSPDEYQKKQVADEIDSLVKNNDFINYYILNNLINTNRYNLLKAQNELKKDKLKHKTFILQNHISNYQSYKNINERLKVYNDFLSITNIEKKIQKMKVLIEEVMSDKKTAFLDLTNYREQLISTSTDTENLIAEIMRSRKSLKDKFAKHVLDEKHYTSCPYCGFIWDTHEIMEIEYRNREEKFRELLTQQSNKLVEIDESISENYITPFTKLLEKYLADNKLIDNRIIAELKTMQDKKIDITELSEIVQIEAVWENIGTYDDLQTDLIKVEEIIETKLEVSSDLFNKIKSLTFKTYENELGIINKIISSTDKDKFVYDKIEKQKTLLDLEKDSEKLKMYLEKAKKDYIYENSKTNDEFNIFHKYFKSEKANFNKIERSILENKIEYIEYMYSIKKSKTLSKYVERQRGLKNIIENIEKMQRAISDVIKQHKKEMADNIKIPFYIYSAKILQNYQQGMGIFLSTSSTNDSIRFLTDSTSDHDAIHHLSSGQLAVTSIAFTLAINKSYNISDNFKFIAIDDPIQEMDSMNIHSFIELIRHEFLTDYQLILSTHNDMNALFMKYKFEKLRPDKISLINVQSEFFN